MKRKMMANRLKYDVLAVANLNGSQTQARNLVISAVNGGKKGFTLAQQMQIQDGERETTVFLKGGIHIPDYATLVSLRDSLNMAIETAKEKYNNSDDDNIKWDN